MGYDLDELPQQTAQLNLKDMLAEKMVNQQLENANLGGGNGSSPPPSWQNATTVMMRNLPNKYTQQMLLSEISQAGFLGTFDFLYLPIDPETNANRGYAFLNFVSPSYAWMFKMAYEGRKMNHFNSSKVASVMKATLQGFEANYAHYSSTRVNRGDPTARPLFLREPENQSSMKGARDSKQRGTRRKGIANNSAERVQTFVAPQPQPPSPYPNVNTYSGLDQKTNSTSQGPVAKSGDGTQQFVPKFCPHCGGPIQPHFQFCPHCGQSIMGREI
jgi:hypothetical protein